MQYKKSTSTIGFKSRSTPNEAKKLASLATALDKKRKEEVKEYNAVSSSQLKELGRLDSLRTNIDNYEISTEKEFNKAFRGVIGTVATNIVPAVENNKYQKGIDLHRRYEAGDPEAIAIIDGNEQQLAEIDEKLAELQRAAEAKGQELDKAALKEERVSLENKLRALNIRKLGDSKAYGFSKGALIEGSEGFMPWFLNATRTRNDEIPNQEFTVADYDKLTKAEDRDAVEDFLLNEYIDKVNSNIGAADTVVESYLTKSVVKQLGRWKSSKLADDETNFAVGQLEGYATNISVEASQFTSDDNKDIEASKEKLTKAVETYLSLGPSAHFRAGTSGSSNAATKAGIIEVVKSIFQKTDDSNDIEDLKDYFADTKFKINNLGTKTLGDHYPFDFDIEDIVSDIATEKAREKESEQLKLKGEYNKESHDLKKLLALGPLDGGISQGEFEVRADAMTEKYSNWYEFDSNISDLRNYVPSYFTPTKSHQIASKELKETDNKSLSLETYLELHPSVRKEYRDKVDFDDYINTPASFAKLETYKEDIETALDKVYVADSINPSFKAKDVILGKVKTHALSTIPSIALQLKKASNEDKPVSDFYDEAYKIVLDDINNARTGGTYFIDGDDNFNDALIKKLDILPETTADKFNDKLKLTTTRLIEAENTISTTNGDAFSMEGVQLFGNMNKDQAEKFFTPRTNDAGQITGLNSEFMEIQKFDPYNRDAYTLFNLARKSYGLEEVDFSTALPNDVIIMQNKIKNAAPHIKALFKTGDMKSMARGFEKINVIHLPTLSDSIVTHIPTEELVLPSPILTPILQEMNVTLDDYNNSKEIKDTAVRIRVNQLLKEASKISENKHVIVRMVATGISGDDMSKWVDSSNEVIGTRVLNTYLGGNIGDGSSNENVDISNYNKVIYSSQEITELKVPVTIEELDNQINALNNELPPKYIPQYFVVENGRNVQVPEGTPGARTFPFVTEFNPEWAIHKEKTDQLNSQKRVIEALKNPSGILWGVDQRSDVTTTQLMYDIRTVIGDNRYRALQQKVNEMNLGYTSTERAIENPLALRSKFKKGTTPYAQAFFNLLLQEKEFFIGEEEDG